MSFECADNYDDSIRNKLKTLKSLKEQVDWNNEEERYRLLYNLYPVISDWNDDQLPELRDIFQPREIEHLLSDSVDLTSGFQHHHRGQRFIKFALATGYKDTPEMEEENGNEQQPLLRRTTAIHRAARFHSPINHTAIGELFKAYDRYDANYIDEWGYTHFHAACEYGFVDVVEKFLDAGQDPDCRLVATATPKSIVDPPLHLALAWGYKTRWRRC
ncbi:unnamed protein product [Trichogramma brassicae]|uniref:Uncharacterized protein n=1 Tax=Trichogramma brassicae TaxID=86971 RepID=A0A6H5IV15_9HYME|nr:unnamed protein product [Trichogramma brassicae]